MTPGRQPDAGTGSRRAAGARTELGGGHRALARAAGRRARRSRRRSAPEYARRVFWLRPTTIVVEGRVVCGRGRAGHRGGPPGWAWAEAGKGQWETLPPRRVSWRERRGNAAALEDATLAAYLTELHDQGRAPSSLNGGSLRPASGPRPRGRARARLSGRARPRRRRQFTGTEIDDDS